MARTTHPPPRAPRGFTLIEVVVVMLIFGVVIAMAAAITRGVVSAQKRTLTGTRMAAIDAALVQFVTQQKRLPCPADGTKASSANNAGVEDPFPPGGACTMTNGVVPWRTLGLSETDATDGWDRRMTYRPYPALALAGGMDMSWCDPAGAEGIPPNPVLAAPRTCTPNCTSANLNACTPPTAFLTTKGLEVRNLAGAALMNPAGNPSTGAAYVVISHGESGGGGYLNTGQLGTSSVGDGTEEMKNYASQPYAPAATYYVDDTPNDIAGTGHFDDIVSRPSVLGVISKAGLGPRAH